jgi:hypothetical protein
MSPVTTLLDIKVWAFMISLHWEPIQRYWRDTRFFEIQVLGHRHSVQPHQSLGL